MNNFFLLTKSSFLSGFNTNKKKNNQSSAFKMMAIVGVIFLLLSSFYSFMFIQMVDTENPKQYDYFLVSVLTITALMSIILSIFQMQSQIFKTKDYEFLESLPITNKTIVASKIASVYLMNLFEDSLIALPSLVLYIIYTGNIYGFILGFISLFFVSLIPLLLSSLIGTIVAILSARCKHKTIITILAYIVFFSLVMTLSFTISFKMTALEEAGQALDLEPFASKIPYFVLLKNAFEISNFWQFIIFILIHLVSFALVVLFISSLYRRINSIESAKEHEEYKETGEKTVNTKTNYLLKKEVKSVLKRPNYLMNSFSGVLVYFMLSILFLFIESSVIGNIEGEDTSDMLLMMKMFVFMVPAMGIMGNTMSSSTSASISIEGKGFELLLSYPIDPKELIKAKIKAAILISIIPTNIISVFVMIAGSILIKEINILFLLQTLILPNLAILAVSLVGMYTGLRWPKINYEIEATIYKNSAAVLFCMLISGLSGLIITGVTVAFNVIYATSDAILFGILGLIVPIVLLSVLIIIFYFVLKANAVRLFYKVLK